MNKQHKTLLVTQIAKVVSDLYSTKDEVTSKIATAISNLKGDNLPLDSDTLKELADKIMANSGRILSEADVEGIVRRLVGEVIEVITQEELDKVVCAVAPSECNLPLNPNSRFKFILVTKREGM